jgi:hypothetical protein
MPVQDNRTRRVLYRRVRRADCDSWLPLEGFHTVCNPTRECRVLGYFLVAADIRS